VGDFARFLAELDARLATLASRLRSLEERLELAERTADGRPTQASGVPDGHLLFVPSSTGYALVHAAGPVPQSGSFVEVPGRAEGLMVAKVGCSPLPADRRSCAYLVPA
jgi:hypothetical protein